MTPGPRSAVARVDAAAARRANAVAGMIGWTSAAMVVWLLAAETDGLPVEEGLSLIACAWAARHPDPAAGDTWTWDPTPRADPRGRRYTVVTYPYEPDHPPPIVLPPVPGVPGGEYTVLRYADPVIPAAGGADRPGLSPSPPRSPDGRPDGPAANGTPPPTTPPATPGR